jgi:hypothetical protein
MAGVMCSICGTENLDAETLCKSCDHLLADGGAAPADEPVAAAPPSGLGRCPVCHAEVPDPSNIVCVECLEPLRPVSSGGAQPRTRRETNAVRLMFSGRQPVDVPQAGSVLLGRDPEISPVAGVFADADNVSRRHASVGVEADGSAWVRDENSTNGTFVNDKIVPRGRTVSLGHGDRLRIASNVVARVEFGGSGLS